MRRAYGHRRRPRFPLPNAPYGIRHLDAILLTHEHKDHIGGLDDVRAFNFVDYPPLVHKVDIYAAPHTLGVVRKDFDYAFAQDKYRGVPEIELHEIDVTRPFRVGDWKSSPYRDTIPTVSPLRATVSAGWPT